MARAERTRRACTASLVRAARCGGRRARSARVAGIACSGVRRSKRAAGVHARSSTGQGALSLSCAPACVRCWKLPSLFMAFAATWQGARTCVSPKIGFVSAFVHVCAPTQVSSSPRGRSLLRANLAHWNFALQQLEISRFKVTVLYRHGPLAVERGQRWVAASQATNTERGSAPGPCWDRVLDKNSSWD